MYPVEEKLQSLFLCNSRVNFRFVRGNMALPRPGLNYQPTQSNNPEEKWPQQYCGGRPKSLMWCRCSRWNL